MAEQLTVPEVGESVTEGHIAQWLKSEGDYVEKDEPVLELETDKINLEVPCPQAGVLTRILRQAGETVQVGEAIAEIDTSAQRPQEQPSGNGKATEGAEERKDASESPAKTQPEERRKPQQQQQRSGGAERIMPAAARALEEHGLQAEEVEATGPGGRLLKEDVLRHVKQGATGTRASQQEQPQAQRETGRGETANLERFREEKAVPMSPLRKRVAQRLVSAQQTAALLTTFNEIDMTEVMALRKRYRDEFEKKYDIKLGFMSFFVKAVIEALKDNPRLNAIIDGDQIIYRNYYDIGIAVSTEHGLVVPIVRNAERMSFAQIEQAIADYAQRARQKKLELHELEGGTFSITNGGIFGSLLSTPIVNPPQSGILGMHAIQDRPVARDGEIVIRPMMYVALTYDHRLVDGREAVTFLRRIKESLEDPARMLLEA